MIALIEKIKFHKENNHRVRLFRQVSKSKNVISNGYILDFSKDFILLHETDDFKVDGYIIVPIKQINKVRFDKVDQYFDKMMRWENEIDKVGISYTIDLTDWKSIFKSLRKRNISIVAECEEIDVNSFTIGPITKIGKKLIHILHFDAEGFFEESPSSIDYNSITRIAFDSEYLNIFSKYTRKRKVK